MFIALLLPTFYREKAPGWTWDPNHWQHCLKKLSLRLRFFSPQLLPRPMKYKISTSCRICGSNLPETTSQEARAGRKGLPAKRAGPGVQGEMPDIPVPGWAWGQAVSLCFVLKNSLIYRAFPYDLTKSIPFSFNPVVFPVIREVKHFWRSRV